MCTMRPREVDMPNSVTQLNLTPIFEWYVVCRGHGKQTEKTCLQKKLDCMLKI